MRRFALETQGKNHNFSGKVTNLRDNLWLPAQSILEFHHFRREEKSVVNHCFAIKILYVCKTGLIETEFIYFVNRRKIYEQV